MATSRERTQCTDRRRPLVRQFGVVALALYAAVYLPLVALFWRYVPGAGASWAWVRAAAVLTVPFLVCLAVVAFGSPRTPSRVRLIGGLAASAPVVGILGGIALWHTAPLAIDRLTSRIEATVPSGWELVEGDEIAGSGCLDVCPSVRRTYRSDRSVQASLEEVTRRLGQRGFGMTEVDADFVSADFPVTGAAHGRASRAYVEVGVGPRGADRPLVHIWMEGRD